MRLWLIPVLASCIGCAAGCAGAGGRRGTACLFESRDSVFLGSGPVYLACAVDQAARVEREYLPSVLQPPAGRTCLSAAFAFVVDEAGAPEGPTIRVERTNDPAFAQAIASVIPSCRYRAAQVSGQPVRQIVRVVKQVAITYGVAGVPGQRPGASSFNC